MTQYIAYYRVSTIRQGNSGLGLEDQRSAVKAFIKRDDDILEEYTETESGKNNDRPQLKAAIADAKERGATLVIAKLDRLSRNAGFIFTLRDSGVQFICADMPDANSMTIGIFAVLAQHEREMISKRTKDALQAKIKQGYKLGTPTNLTDQARAKGVTVRRENAKNNVANKQATHLILSEKERGKSIREIVSTLNNLGFRTRRGNKFRVSSVHKLYCRANS